MNALLQAVSQAVIGTDREGRMLLVNRRAEEMFGYSREELLGASIEILVPVALRDAHTIGRNEFFARPRSRPMGIGMDLTARHKSGREFPVEISLSYVETQDGGFALALVNDITRRRKLEEQLLHAQKMEAVGRLAAGVAHDFNNLLTVISGYSHMVLEELPAGDPSVDCIEQVIKAAERASALTHRLLIFSRQQVTRTHLININELLNSTEKMLRRVIGEDVELVLKLAPDAAAISADSGQIEQAIINLVVNSRDAMPQGGRITIETRNARFEKEYTESHVGALSGDYLMIAVTDTGHGMDAETQSHIFEPFFTTKEKGKGTGLGLATVYGVVKQSGGDIRVYSQPASGTTFKLYFPAANQQGASSPENQKTLPDYRGTETILVVEDEAIVRELIARLLSQLGYHVLAAASGHEAVRFCEQYQDRIALLVTDIIMPKMSGTQVASAIRVLRPEIKVLYISGYTDEAILQHGVLDPGQDFLPKPFTRESLGESIRKILDP